MKKIILLGITAVAVILLINSCKKEISNQAETVTQNELKMGGGGGNNLCPSRAPICGGVLEFTDEAEFEAVLLCLENQYEEWCDDFESANSSLTENEYNALIESTNWDEEQTLVNWENSSPGYYSLRRFIRQQVEIWMQNDVLNIETDPDNFPIDDEVERTLYNNFGQVKIGNILIDYEANGGMYTVENPTCDDIITLQTNPQSMIGKTGVTYYPPNGKKKGNVIPEAGASCFDVKEYDYSDIKTVDNFKFKYRVHAWEWDNQWAKAIARVKSYKKKNGNGWKRWRPETRVQVVGYWYAYNDYDGDCKIVDSYNKLKPECGENICWRKRHTLRAKKKNGESYRYRLQQNGSQYPISGGFNINNITSWNYNASW